MRRQSSHLGCPSFWGKSKYVRAMLENLKETDPGSESSPAQRERLHWALVYADEIDPLTTGDGDSGC